MIQKRVLLVEDDESLREVVTDKLTERIKFMKRMCFIVLVMVFMLCNTACGPTGEKAGGSTDSPAGSVRETSNTRSTALDLGKEDNTRITVAVSMPENRFIDTAAANFQKNNPGIIVDVKYYTTMGETITRKTADGGVLAISENTDPGGEKYLKTISTELMSGQGPDIIDTRYIPGGRYADNGFLYDLGKIIEKDPQFNSSDFYENIINSVKYKGGLYTMPIGFLVSVLTGKYSLPASTGTDKLTWDAFFKSAGEALKAQGVEGPTMMLCGQTELFSVLFHKNYGRFVDEESKKCYFTSEEFIKIIKLVKEAADKKLITGSNKNIPKNTLDLYMFRNEVDANIAARYKSPEENSELYVYPIPVLDGESGMDADIYYEYGINNNSKSKGAAWKFIKYLLSEEMQTSPELFVFPVNKKAVAEKSLREKWTDTKTVLTEEDPVFSRANVYKKINWQIYKIAEEETQKYFEGKRSAEETAEIIQSRANVVISE